MDSDINSLKREGIAAMKRGERSEAHRLFQQMVARNPNDPVALVFASVTAPEERQSEALLRAAHKIDPAHPAVRHGWKWLAARRKTQQRQPPQNHWSSRDLESKPARPKTWLIAAGTLGLIFTILAFFLILVMGTFYYLNVLQPQAQAAFPNTSTAAAITLQSATPIPTYTRFVTASPTLTRTPQPTATLRPTRTLTPTITLSAAEATDLAYPPVQFNDFLSDPDRFTSQSLRLTGMVVGFGEARLNGQMTFALLLGPPPDQLPGEGIVSPLLVLGIAPDAAFDLEVIVTVYGLGGEQMDSLTVQGVSWDGPVLLGEGIFSLE